MSHSENYIREQLSRKSFASARFSNVFIEQLADFLENRRFNIFQIFDVVEAILNGNLKSKKGIRQFKKSLLEGYSYVHWSDAAFIQKNLSNHRGVNSKYRDDKLSNHISGFVASSGIVKGEDIPPELTGAIAHTVVHEAYFQRKREGKMTDEWIIFNKVDRFYEFYSIAFHSEEDEVIKARLLKANFT